MKRTLLTFFACIMISFMAMAQDSRFNFNISGGTSNAVLKNKMEKQVRKLLTKMNYAQKNNSKSLDFKGIDINNDAKRYILKMWNRKHLCVWQDEEGETNYIESLCLKFGTEGYQVRNIPMREFPVDGNAGNSYTEVCINFDFNGKIVDFSIAMKNVQYEGIAKKSNPVKSERERMMIEHFMHQMEQAYQEKNISFFETIFSENALIITGVKTFKTIKTDIKTVCKEDYKYIVKTKEQYLANLRKIFIKNKNTNIYVNFTNIKVKKAMDGEYYIAYAGQEWASEGYEDLGKITILWDFRDPQNPQILVRVWQYSDDDKTYKFNSFPLEKN